MFRGVRIRTCGSLLLVVVGLLAFAAATADAAGNFAWDGSASDSNWSDGTNWVGGAAPSGTVGTISFPVLIGLCGACYATTDDLSGISATGLSISDGAAVDLTGSDPLTLGAGGITVQGQPIEIDVPLVLSAPQSWSFPNLANGMVTIDGGVTGNRALGIDLGGRTLLGLGGSETLGAVTITGDDSGQRGLDAYENGIVSLTASGSALNATNGNSVDLVDAALAGEGGLGPLTSTGGALTVGYPAGTLAVDGAVTLDSTSAMQFAVVGGGTTAGSDYSQLTAAGDVNLAGAQLQVTGQPPIVSVSGELPAEGQPDPGPCPTITAGATYTLLKTDGTLTGTFGNAPPGTIVSLFCNNYPYFSPTVEINYTSDSVTATVVYAGPPTTTTGLSYSPSSPVTNQTVTLTATVTASSGAPDGTVSFLADGRQITACQGLALDQVDSAYVATCQLPFAAATSPHTVQAFFHSALDSDGVTWLQVGSSSPTESIIVGQAQTTTGPRPVIPAASSTISTLTIGHLRVLGDGVHATITYTPTAGSNKKIALALNAKETLQGGKVVAASASKGHHHDTTKIVLVGSATAEIGASGTTTVSITLNSTGRRLLAAYHELKTSLQASTGGDTASSTAEVTFKTAKRSQ